MTQPKVAVFDLDGTITRRDTLIPFLRRLSVPRLLWGIVRAFPWMVAGLWNRSRRDDAKKAVISASLGGKYVQEIEEAAGIFAERLLSTGLNAPVIERVTKHQDSGHRVAIASATPSVLVTPIAEALGIHDVIASELEISDGVYTGRLAGANNRSEEKQRRVLATLGAPPDYAYGNLPDDRALLDAAVSAYVIANETITPFTQRSA